MTSADFYPGSKQRRRSTLPPPEPVHDDTAWDAHPVILPLNGVPTEFFTVGALALALRRGGGSTIRKWEELGFIPKCPYRFPGRGQKGQRRLYTRELVEGLMKIAQEEKMFDSYCAISKTNFPMRAAALFQEAIS